MGGPGAAGIAALHTHACACPPCSCFLLPSCPAPLSTTIHNCRWARRCRRSQRAQATTRTSVQRRRQPPARSPSTAGALVHCSGNPVSSAVVIERCAVGQAASSCYQLRPSLSSLELGAPSLLSVPVQRRGAARRAAERAAGNRLGPAVGAHWIRPGQHLLHMLPCWCRLASDESWCHHTAQSGRLTLECLSTFRHP